MDINNYKGTYVLDPAHTEIGFVARHAMITKVRGEFKDFDSTLVIDPENGYSVTATMKSASVTTGNEDRDAHILGEDFFDVEKYPEITFVSTSADIDYQATGGVVYGDLTIKGVTKPVTLVVEIYGLQEDPFGNERVGFSASTTINRTDFGVDFQAPLNSGGVLVSENIIIDIEGSGIKQ